MTTATLITYGFPIAAAHFINTIFKDFWFSSYGASLPFKKVRMKIALIVPIMLMLLGIFSLFTSGWSEPIELLPKLMLFAVAIPATYQLIRWRRTPSVYDTTMDLVVHASYPYALRVDPTRSLGENDAVLRAFQTSDTYMLPNVSLEALVMLYTEHLKWTDHVISSTPFIVIKEQNHGVDFEVLRFDSTQANAGDADLRWIHQIVREPHTGFVSFHSDQA